MYEVPLCGTARRGTSHVDPNLAQHIKFSNSGHKTAQLERSSTVRRSTHISSLTRLSLTKIYKLDARMIRSALVIPSPSCRASWDMSFFHSKKLINRFRKRNLDGQRKSEQSSNETCLCNLPQAHAQTLSDTTCLCISTGAYVRHSLHGRARTFASSTSLKHTDTNLQEHPSQAHV